MKNFVNPDMEAFNAKAIPIDHSIVAEFADPTQLPGHLIGKRGGSKRWNSDIEWISADDEEAFRVFESAFERLGIPEHAAPYADIEQGVRLFGGFLVVRSYCTEPYFHTDWKMLNNEAFTVLTPVTQNAENFGLLYRKYTGEIGEYEYRPGEAILFGDNFLHSTKPREPGEPVVLLCFQFGSDKMKHWKAINSQLNIQATLLQRPDGRLIRTGGVPSRVVT